MAIFNLHELGVIHMMIDNAIESAEELSAPTAILDTLSSILDKIRPMIDEECRAFNEFVTISETLEDVEMASKILIKDPEAQIPEYK